MNYLIPECNYVDSNIIDKVSPPASHRSETYNRDLAFLESQQNRVDYIVATTRLRRIQTLMYYY